MRTRLYPMLLAGLSLASFGVEPATAETSAKSVADCPATPYAMSVRFQANSAEINALRYQAYNVATRQLDDIVAERGDGDDAKPPAVVLDLDETVLDNSPMEAVAVARCIDYTDWGDIWQLWVHEASAPMIPGAKAFLEHADDAGVAIYYVSNRVTKNLDATVKNLKAHDLPQAEAAHVRLAGPPKTERRAGIAANHDIVMLVGDSLHDFDGVFADKSLSAEHDAVNDMKDAFGRRFIVLPNASYGSWTDSALLPGDESPTP